MRVDWQGRAWLVIANGVEPGALADYETWHSVEHVPERLTMPGFLGARRFVACRAEGPHFLTVYDLAEPTALDTPEYKRLLVSPTPASRAMRPRMTGFRRTVYSEVGRAGTGCGRHLGVVSWTGEASSLDHLVGREGIVSLRWGNSIATAPHPAFAASAVEQAPHSAALISATAKAGLDATMERLPVETIDSEAYELIEIY